jgi:hypothetical protein
LIGADGMQEELVYYKRIELKALKSEAEQADTFANYELLEHAMDYNNLGTGQPNHHYILLALSRWY